MAHLVWIPVVKNIRVKIEHGWLEGSECVNVFGGEKFYCFKGIPYAKPPVRELRFKAPQPLDPWFGLRYAKHHGPVCYQFDMFTNKILPGKEDCLYINVYSKNLNGKSPVMVWIFGGGFMSGHGNSDLYGPDFLVHNDVVLVTFNYRVDALGFLSLENELVPGNAGMKDQVAALKWVQNNIKEFGGDSENVTIFGESAGSACVGFHMISPMSKGLFNKAIMQSGSIITDWACTIEPKKRAFLLGKELGLETQNVNELYDFLMKTPVEKLIAKKTCISAHEELNAFGKLSFVPVVEKHNKKDPFLPDDPSVMIKQGKFHDVPLMIGHMSEDGLLGIKNIQKFVENLNQYPEYFLPERILMNISVSNILAKADQVKQFYFGNRVIKTSMIRELIRFATCTIFTYDNYQFMNFFQRFCSSKVYSYVFSCKSDRNIMARYFGPQPPIEPSSCHADDLVYLFPCNHYNLPLKRNTRSYRMVQQTCKLWTNFAKYGNPTPDHQLGVKWKPYKAKRRNILDIGEQLVSKLAGDDEEMKIWDKIQFESEKDCKSPNKNVAERIGFNVFVTLFALYFLFVYFLLYLWRILSRKGFCRRSH